MHGYRHSVQMACAVIMIQCPYDCQVVACQAKPVNNLTKRKHCSASAGIVGCVSQYTRSTVLAHHTLHLLVMSVGAYTELPICTGHLAKVSNSLSPTCLMNDVSYVMVLPLLSL